MLSNQKNTNSVIMLAIDSIKNIIAAIHNLQLSQLISYIVTAIYISLI